MKDDHRSYIRNFCICEKEAWFKIQTCTGFEPLTFAIPVQRSTNLATNNCNDQVGSGGGGGL